MKFLNYRRIKYRFYFLYRNPKCWYLHGTNISVDDTTQVSRIKYRYLYNILISYIKTSIKVQDITCLVSRYGKFLSSKKENGIENPPLWYTSLVYYMYLVYRIYSIKTKYGLDTSSIGNTRWGWVGASKFDQKWAPHSSLADFFFSFSRIFITFLSSFIGDIVYMYIRPRDRILSSLEHVCLNRVFLSQFPV